MKINLPIYYKVDKKEQIVVAKFKQPYFDCLEYLRCHSSTNAYDGSNIGTSYIMLDDIEAKAKCFKGDAVLGKPADVYDVEFGKKLARTRLMRKFYRRLEIFFKEMENIFQKFTLECTNLKNKSFQKAFNCDEHLKRLIAKTKQ